MKLAELNDATNDELREALENSDFLTEVLEAEIVETGEFVSSLVDDNPQDGAIELAKYASRGGATFAYDYVRVDGPYYRDFREANSISELIYEDEVDAYREHLKSKDSAEELASIQA